jgi:hypothetical protein
VKQKSVLKDYSFKTPFIVYASRLMENNSREYSVSAYNPLWLQSVLTRTNLNFFAAPDGGGP